MACYHPITCWRVLGSSHPSTGKECIVFKLPSGCFKAPKNYEELSIPCGQCIGCRLDYSREWAVRCVLEASYYPSEYNWFVTLTYDDDNVPRSFTPISDDNGEVISTRISYPLCPRDLTLFFKRLREYYDREFNHTGIRYYACGEYGDRKNRPHYHVIFFNLPIADIHPIRARSQSGCLQFESDVISKLWNKGLVRLSEVNFDTCAYTARYMLKKHKGADSDYYEVNGLVPEFCRMSRRPGIGKHFYDDNFDKLYSYDNFILKCGDFSRPTKPPHYFDRLYEIDFPSEYENVKSRRKSMAERSLEFELLNTSKDYYSYLLDKEYLHTSRASALVRDL